jgi:hypothetical protein
MATPLLIDVVTLASYLALHPGSHKHFVFSLLRNEVSSAAHLTPLYVTRAHLSPLCVAYAHLPPLCVTRLLASCLSRTRPLSRCAFKSVHCLHRVVPHEHHPVRPSHSITELGASITQHLRTSLSQHHRAWG